MKLSVGHEQRTAAIKEAARLLLPGHPSQREWEDARAAFFRLPQVRGRLSPKQLDRAAELERDTLARRAVAAQ